MIWRLRVGELQRLVVDLAAGLSGSPVTKIPPTPARDQVEAAENAFAWVYSLQSGMLA